MLAKLSGGQNHTQVRFPVDMDRANDQEIFQAALAHHQAGRLAAAETLYRDILARQPRHAPALHCLGVIAYRTGRRDVAADLIHQSLAAQPGNAGACCDLAGILKENGELDQAIAAYRQAIALKPDLADAHNNLGNALWEKHQVEEAISHYRQAIQLKPDYPEAFSNLGNALRDKGQLEESIVACRTAIQLNPNYPQAHNNLANALRESGQTHEAIAACRVAIGLKADFAEAHGNLGLAHSDAGQLDEGIAAYRHALTLRPNYAQAHYNLANALRDKGQQVAAAAAYRQAIALAPNFPDAFNNLGNLLNDLGRTHEAIAAYHQAIALRPDMAQAHTNLGNALADQGRLDEAIAAARTAVALPPESPEARASLANILWQSGRFEEAIDACRVAIQLKPDFGKSHNILGNALKDSGQVQQAVAAYRKAVALCPDDAVAHSNLVYALHFHPDYDAPAIAREASIWNLQHAEPLKTSIQPHANDRDPDRRLRIGYVSPDFFRQAESFFTVPLLEAHDHEKYEIHCYASVLRPDDITDRLRRSANVWHDVVGLRDADLAEQIRRDQIDILVDLTMHMNRNRLLVFARKPAPLQFTWLAYPGGTGMPSIDCRITDAHMDPADRPDDAYAEESMRLADCWCCYNPLSQIEPAAPRRAGPISFGSPNNPCKLNPPILQVWADLMKQVTDSRLLLLTASAEQQKRIGDLFEQAGVAPGRLTFVSRLSRVAYLRLYDQIDIALDTLPYNGITTTCDALWMGVPAISVCGKTAAGRAGLSILSTVGLPELAAQTPEQFIRIGIELASAAPRRAELRAMLRHRMSASALMDAKGFARKMEDAYRVAWRRWCAEE